MMKSLTLGPCNEFPRQRFQSVSRSTPVSDTPTQRGRPDPLLEGPGGLVSRIACGAGAPPVALRYCASRAALLRQSSCATPTVALRYSDLCWLSPVPLAVPVPVPVPVPLPC